MNKVSINNSLSNYNELLVRIDKCSPYRYGSCDSDWDNFHGMVAFEHLCSKDITFASFAFHNLLNLSGPYLTHSNFHTLRTLNTRPLHGTQFL